MLISVTFSGGDDDYRLSASYFPINGPTGTADYQYEIDIDENRQNKRVSSQINKILQQDQLTLRVIYSISPYEKETDTVPFPGIRKTLTVTIDLTPKSPKEF